MGFSKQQFACIRIAAIHVDTKPLRVWVPCEANYTYIALIQFMQILMHNDVRTYVIVELYGYTISKTINNAVKYCCCLICKTFTCKP